MSEGSPRPWKAVENSWQYTTIYDANGNEVCRLNLERFAGLSEDTQEHYEAIQRADVELILQAAVLTPQGGGKSCAHPRTQWYSGQYEKTLECLDCRVELDERKL